MSAAYSLTRTAPQMYVLSPTHPHTHMAHRRSHDTKRPDPKLMLEEDNAAGYAAQDVQAIKDRGWSQFKDGVCGY